MTPVFVGGCLRAYVEWRAKSAGQDVKSQTDRGVLMGSGLIAGEGLTGVAIALWAFLAGSKPAGLGLSYPAHVGEAVSLIAFAVLGYLLVWASRRETDDARSV